MAKIDLGLVKGADGRTLSLNGIQPDANGNLVVGAKDVGAAPAGFGLGEKVSPVIEDLNAAVASGVYSFFGSAINNPFVSPYISWPTLSGVVEVVSKSEDHAVQVVRTTNATAPLVVQRSLYGGEWLPNEWVNPPMIPGVEYRTTERYLGKPVYVKVMSFGALPNASMKQETLTLEGVESLVSCSGITGGGTVFPCSNPSDANIGTISLFANIYGTTFITTTADWSGKTANIIFKYTKTTDT